MKTLLTKLKYIIAWGAKIQLVAGVLTLATVVITITAGIISRYIFNSPFDWTEELCTILFIWLSFLGAGVASAKRRHVAVDFITGKLPARYMNLVRIVTNALIIALMVLIACGSVILLPQMSSHTSTALNIPKLYYYLPIAIVSIYMTLVYTAELIEAVQAYGLKHKEVKTVEVNAVYNDK